MKIAEINTYEMHRSYTYWRPERGRIYSFTAKELTKASKDAIFNLIHGLWVKNQLNEINK